MTPVTVGSRLRLKQETLLVASALAQESSRDPSNPLIYAVWISQGPEKRLQHLVPFLRSSQMVFFPFWERWGCTGRVKGD